MKKFAVVCLFISSLCILPAAGYAASSLQVILEDSLWGAAIGTLVGGATLAFTDHPSDHMERLAQGASIGLVGGMAFGLYEISPMITYTRDPRTDERIYGLNLTIPLK